jgi:hypothetical protein
LSPSCSESITRSNSGKFLNVSFSDEEEEQGEDLPTSGGGVSESQSNLLGRVDYFISPIFPSTPALCSASIVGELTDEDGPDGERKTLLVNVGFVEVIKHSVKGRNISVLVADDGEFKVSTFKVVDILDPSVVRVDVVGR